MNSPFQPVSPSTIPGDDSPTPGRAPPGFDGAHPPWHVRARYRLRYAAEAVRTCWNQALGFRRIRNRLSRHRALCAVRASLIATLIICATMAHPPPIQAERSVSFGGGTTNPFGLTDIGSVSRPTFVDIDADGDLDAFVGEHDGGGFSASTYYFENTGTAISPAFAGASSDPFGLSTVQADSSPAFADLDGDGDLDLFIGDYYGNTICFLNSGSATSPAFSYFSSNPFGLTTVGTGTRAASTPTFADLDGDGDLDAFIGEYDGTTNYFANTGTAASPAFTGSSANPFGLTDEGLYSVPSFADLDEDGDLDGFFGFGDGNYSYFENTGSPTSPSFATVSDGPFGLTDVGLLSYPAFADIDADGDLDAFSGEWYGSIHYLQNTGQAARFRFRSVTTNPFGLSDVGEYSKPTFADLNSDGDLDAFVGDEDTAGLKYFINIGTVTNPSFSATSSNPYGLSNVHGWPKPTFADLDGDGDLDAFVGNDYGEIIYWRNDGTVVAPTFTGPTANPFGLSLAPADNYAAPSFADLDGDGDLDAFIGAADGDIRFFINSGSATNPAFLSMSDNPFGLTGVGAGSTPTFSDLDGDGDLDAFVGSGTGSFAYFQNTGSAILPTFAAATVNPFGLVDVGTHTSPVLVDLDGDGDLDFCTGENKGNVRCWRNEQLQTVYLPLLLRNF